MCAYTRQCVNIISACVVTTQYHIAQNSGGKTLMNQLFQDFGEDNFGEFTISSLSILENLEFGWVAKTSLNDNHILRN